MKMNPRLRIGIGLFVFICGGLFLVIVMAMGNKKPNLPTFPTPTAYSININVVDWSKTHIGDRVILEGRLDYSSMTTCASVEGAWRCGLFVRKQDGVPSITLWMLQTKTKEPNHVEELGSEFNPQDVIVYGNDSRQIHPNDQVRVTGKLFKDSNTVGGMLVEVIDLIGK